MLKLDTAGGDVTAQRIIGGKLDLHTHAGRFNVDVIYSDDLHITCGSAVVQHMRIGNDALIEASLGGVHIHGLDGCASVSTAGGAIEVQAQEQTRKLVLASKGGDVVLRVPEQVNGGLHLSAKAEGGVTIASPLSLQGGANQTTDGANHTSGGAHGGEVVGLLAGVGGEGSAHRLFLSEGFDVEGNKVAPAACTVSIDAGSGKIDVLQRSWFETKFGKLAPGDGNRKFTN
jgi:hypothetical protein